MSVIVELTEEELEQASRNAAIIQGVHGEELGVDSFYGMGDLIESTTVGEIGELAFSKYYNLYPPYVNENVKSDSGYDFLVRHIPTGDIKKIDVKSSTYIGGDLLHPESIPLTADIYVSCEVDRDKMKVEIVGAGTKKQMENTFIRRAGMKTPARVLNRRDLKELPGKDEIEPVFRFRGNHK